MDGPDLIPVTAMGLSILPDIHSQRSRRSKGKGDRETLAAAEEAAAAMPAEGRRIAGLWEREVGCLRPKRFANSVMASQVQPPSPALSPLPSSTLLAPPARNRTGLGRPSEI